MLRGTNTPFWFAVALTLGFGGCGTTPAETNIALAQTYRSHVAAGRIDEARAMLSQDARIWFGTRRDNGRRLDPAPGAGAWAAWDRHFRSRSEVVEWTATLESASVTVLETNDYYELLERGPQRNILTYFIDSDGRITGVQIQGQGPRPMGRTDEFLIWARVHEPSEVGALMPNGDIDPRGDHPQRFRALLNRWRENAGQRTIE